jgi:MFS family permease
LRLLQLIPVTRNAQTVTGITFAAAGVVTAVAAVIYSRLVRRTSYRTVNTAAALLMGLTMLAAAASSSAALLIVMFVASSFVSGSLIPALGAMIGLETPTIIQATIFGVSSSAVSIGFGLGPLLGGLVASLDGVQAGLAFAGVVGLVLGAVLFFGAREPRPASRPPTIIGSTG